MVPDNSGVLPFHSAGFDCSKLFQGRLIYHHLIFFTAFSTLKYMFYGLLLRRCKNRVDDRVIGDIIVRKELDRNGPDVPEFDKKDG